MNCEQYREIFSDFIDGALKDSQIEDFRNHLKDCKACREEFRSFKQAQMLLQLLPKEEAPLELVEMTITQVRLKEGMLVSFLQSVGIFEGVGQNPLPSAPIYETLFGMPKFG